MLYISLYSWHSVNGELTRFKQISLWHALHVTVPQAAGAEPTTCPVASVKGHLPHVTALTLNVQGPS